MAPSVKRSCVWQMCHMYVCDGHCVVLGVGKGASYRCMGRLPALNKLPPPPNPKPDLEP